jgi:omega-6 fatty acid desaturase (delta-12 desaturase)
MHFATRVSYWITRVMAIPAGAFLARTFISFHDCGHGSFFSSRRRTAYSGSSADEQGRKLAGFSE